MARNNNSKPVSFPNGTPPRSKSSSSNADSNKVKWVNPHLNDDDITELTDIGDNQSAYICEFIAQLPPGYSLSLKYEDRSGRWLASCVVNSSDDGNSGYAVSIRAADSEGALLALAYCCAVKLDWQFTQGATGNTGRFG